MGHEHEHDHTHGHGVSVDADRRWLTVALVLIGGFMVVEVVVGLLANSLALLSDAAHMLTDAASIVLALGAIRLAARPARGKYTYGYKRAEILSAQANGITLLVLAGWLTYEAVRRLLEPPEVTGGLVVVTALVGIVVNIAATWAISKANRSSLNVEGAFQHVLNDLYGFIATAVAGLVVLFTGFARADAIATLIVVALMVKAGLGLVRESGRIFLEAAPAGVDPDVLGHRLVEIDGVDEVHDLHVWQITSGDIALSAHVLVRAGADCHGLRQRIERLLDHDYDITHTTLQVDHSHVIDAAPAADPQRLLPVLDDHCDDAHGPVHRDRPASTAGIGAP
ncbi:cation diffusion facilitator family transporter [Nocardia sp. NBC_01730]|uniref:cation diffusion facilitator family transporter n=1 Tax=Nocardia sp. NBC_01730 TaxID=2975998 RepID=UPI002E0F7EDD